MKEKRPLRILMVLDMPWDPNMGGPRVHIELSEEYQKHGHVVDKFSMIDAFPHTPYSRLSEIVQPYFFAQRAAAFVHQHGHQYDVIDSHIGTMSIPKGALGFDGLVVARSHGLYAFYEEFNRVKKVKWPEKMTLRLAAHRALHQIAGFRARQNPLNSLKMADLIILLNDDELDFVRKNLGLGSKARVIPNGLSEARLHALDPGKEDVVARWSKRSIVFIGGWAPRKGARDWGLIVRQVRKEIPDARFLFLGTGFNSEVVLRDLALPPCDWISILPSFETAKLPKLLAGATVAAFPSYIEGFPIAVLEKLAAGLPLVAYSVPGPRGMLRELPYKSMVSAGDAAGLAAALVSLLRLGAQDYLKLSENCRQVARRYNWSEIASQTLSAYQEKLMSLPGKP